MSKAGTALIAIVVIAAVIFAYLWFFVLSPAFIEKPEIEKPDLDAGNINADNVNWAVNELGVYKLHAHPLTNEPPLIETVITDQNISFITTVKGNVPATIRGSADIADISISLTSADFERLYNAEDVRSEASLMYEEGSVGLELLKDTTTLAAKGYKVIYDEFYS